MKRDTLQHGFTLIELLVVAALIIMLTAISLVNFRGTSERTRNSKRQADISQVRSALELYRATNQKYPIYSASNKVTNFTSLLNDATFKPYLSTPSLTDPNNVSPYQYEYQAAANGFTYSICYTVEPAGTQTCLTNP
ncbi:MAG: type II secretion system protein [Patescibacteria group bacterium]